MTTWLELASGDHTVSWPRGDWTLEVYFRMGDGSDLRDDGAYVDILWDEGLTWIRLTRAGEAIDVEVRSESEFYEDTLIGFVPNDGCFHQLVWGTDQSDAHDAYLFLDGELVAQEQCDYVDTTGGGLPAYLRWGAGNGMLGTGMEVELSHIAFWPAEPDSIPGGIGGIQERGELIGQCCTDCEEGIYVGPIVLSRCGPSSAPEEE